MKRVLGATIVFVGYFLLFLTAPKELLVFLAVPVLHYLWVRLVTRKVKMDPRSTSSG